jgi:hypothetical protein
MKRFRNTTAFVLGLAIGAGISFSPVRRVLQPTALIAAPQQTQVPTRMGMSEQERLIELERRMASVEKQLAEIRKGTSADVKAPFRVIDSHGNPIFGVYDVEGSHSANLYGKALEGSVVLSANADGQTTVKVLQGASDMAELSSYGGAGRLRLFSGNSEIASLMKATDGGGLTLFNSGTRIAYIGAGDIGGGKWEIGDPAGGVAARGQWHGDGAEVCVARKTGTHCLGIGLPLR